MKYVYKEIRKLDFYDLRKLCIKRDWYTGGNNDEYHNMLQMAKKENITTDDIVEIATDIYSHSQLEDGYSMKEHIENICFEIAGICNTFFEEV